MPTSSRCSSWASSWSSSSRARASSAGSSGPSSPCSWVSSTAGWWRTKSRQAFTYVRHSVSTAECRRLEMWLDPPKLELFDSMHGADQRHGLDVVALLRSDGYEDEELLLAGLLHDCSKGPTTGLLHRVAWSLGERYGEGVIEVAVRLPGFAAAFERLRDHAEDSAALARAAGCTERTADLIRYQATPRTADTDAGIALQRADDAS